MNKKSNLKPQQDETLRKRNLRILGVIVCVCIVGYSAFVARKLGQLSNNSAAVPNDQATSNVSYTADDKRVVDTDALMQDASEIDRQILEKLHRKQVKRHESPGAARAVWHQQTEQVKEQLEQLEPLKEAPKGSIQDQLQKKLERYEEDKPSI